MTIAAIPLAAAIGMLAERRPMRAMQWFGAVLAVTVVFQMLGPAHLLAAVLASIVVVRLGIDRFRSGLVRVGPLVAAGAVFAVALPVYSLSRTDGPPCRPDSIWQGHALWHLLVGAGVVALAAGLGLLPKGGTAGPGGDNRSIGSDLLR